MPTYDYACSACEREFTVEKAITDDSTSPCPGCESEETRRLISRTSFVLKGGGWYEDGYGSSGTGSSGTGTDATATTSTSTSSDD